MVISIPTTTKKYFRLHLELIRSIPPLDGLRYKELDVLAELLYWNYMFKDVSKDERWKLIFNYDTKLKMRESIFMEADQFNNCLTSLRKKGIIKGKSVISDFGVDPDNPFIKIDFKIS